MKRLLLNMDDLLGLLTKLCFVFSALALLPTITALVGAEVLQRYFLSDPISWSHEVSTLLLLAFLFGSLPMAIRQREFIRVTLLLRRMPVMLQKLAHSLTTLFALLLSALFAQGFYTIALDMRQFGERALYIDLPYWPFAAYVSALSALLCIALVSQLLCDWLRD